MIIHRLIMCTVILSAISGSSGLLAQEKKLENLRSGGGSASAAQMSIWFAKEGNYYEKKRDQCRTHQYSRKLAGAAGDVVGRAADHSSGRRGSDPGRPVGHGYGRDRDYREEI